MGRAVAGMVRAVALVVLLGLCAVSDAACMKTDGTGACCYQADVSFTGDFQPYGAPNYTASPLFGAPPDLGSLDQPLAHAFSIDAAAYSPPADMWGWGDFFYVESQQFVFPKEVAAVDLINVNFRANGCGGESNIYVDPAPAFHAVWQGGSASSSSTNLVFQVNYSAYLKGGGSGQSSKTVRNVGDPLYITVIPCGDSRCASFDSKRAIAIQISFRSSDVTSACVGEFDGGTGFGYDCCYVSKSIAFGASQEEINAAVNVTTYGGGDAPTQPCIQKPYFQCFDTNFRTVGSDKNAGDAWAIQYKGSLVPFISDANRKLGRGLRIVLADLVTVNMALSTTYIEYTVDPSTQWACNSLCKDASGFPTEFDLRATKCFLNAVSSFAETNGGMVSVAGFGTINGYSAQMASYFSQSPDYDSVSDASPGHDCPSCNRFCPLTPYAQGMHQLAACCFSPESACSSSFAAEAGDARFHIDSGLLELSSDCKQAKFAVDIAEVTVSNTLKRGDGSVMIQSPGHFVRNADCFTGTIAEQKASCSGPNLPTRTFALKYLGAWHDASDGPSIKSENSEMLYTYVQNTDDCLKPYSGTVIRDSTVLHGGVGGAITPCTYNLLGYTPGCKNTQTLNTHIVRSVDPYAGYDGRGGIIATRYCAGKSTLAWTNLGSTGNFSNNIIDGVVVEALGTTNQAGRAVSIIVDAPQDASPVYFCPSSLEQISLEFSANAFVLKNWVVGPFLDGSLQGPAVLVSGTTSQNLGQYSATAIDVRGLGLSIGSWMGCSLTGEYYPCPYGHGDTKQTSCFLKEGAGPPEMFSELNQGDGPCSGWYMIATIDCPDVSQCPVVFPWGSNPPSSVSVV